mgnify:CR=1 FL=1
MMVNEENVTQMIGAMRRASSLIQRGMFPRLQYGALSNFSTAIYILRRQIEVLEEMVAEHQTRNAPTK